MTTQRILFGCLLVGSIILPALGVRAQAPDKPTARSVDQLAVQQGVVADKYAKLEKLLEDMARIEAVSNPKRAALLMQALKQSKENLTAAKLNSIIKLLSQEQLKRALENQQDVRKDFQGLLELLLSENRSDRLKSEQERVREYFERGGTDPPLGEERPRPHRRRRPDGKKSPRIKPRSPTVPASWQEDPGKRRGRRQRRQETGRCRRR